MKKQAKFSAWTIPATFARFGSAPPLSLRTQSAILGGVIATFSGMMLSLDRGSVQPDNFSRDLTFYILTALVLGGVARVSGSIVGPMLFWALLAFIETRRRNSFEGAAHALGR